MAGVPRLVAEADQYEQWRLAAEAWLTEVALAGSRNTADAYRCGIRAYLEAFPDPRLATPGEVQVWTMRRTKRGPTPSLRFVDWRRNVVSKFYQFCQRMKLLDDNPAGNLPRVKPRRKPVKEVTYEHIRILLASYPDSYTGAKLRALTVLIVLTGLRRAEALGLCGRSFTSREGILYYTTQVKGGDIERAEMPTPALEAIEAMLRREGRTFARLKPRERVFRWHPVCASRTFHRTARRAGLDLTLHDLRRATAQVLERLGVPHREIQGVLRHSSILTTEQSYLISTRREQNPYWPAMAREFGLT